MNRDFVCGLLSLALAGVYYALASDIQSSQLADDVGADGLPKIYAYALGALGAVLTLSNLPLRATLDDSAKATTSSAQDLVQLRRALGILAIGVGYVLLAPVIGYVPAIALVIIGTAVYQGGALDWRLALIGVLGAGFLWLVFVALLHIKLPSGVLMSWGE